MTRLRRASVIAALFLLASAATAYAECAWVLWVQSKGGTWQPWYGYTSREECDKAASINAAGKLLGSDEFACLPDTVDPRGPKAK